MTKVTEDTKIDQVSEVSNNGEFYDELKNLINEYSKENGSNTPDFILANYLNSCLIAFDNAVNLRTQWYK